MKEKEKEKGTVPFSAQHPQGVFLRSSGIGPTGRLETALPVGDWKSPLLARNTGRVKHAPPSRRVKHAAPSGARKDAGPSRRRGRRRSGRRRSCRVSGIGSFKEKEEGGTGKSPLLIPRETGRGIVHQRRPPRCRCRTTRRDDPCGRPPPERRYRPSAIAWALPDRGGGAATF